MNKHSIALEQHQYDALLSLAYNLGEYYFDFDGESPITLENSDIGMMLVNGKYEESEVDRIFGLYNKQNGKTLEGLTKRRAAEAKMFNEGFYDMNLYDK